MTGMGRRVLAEGVTSGASERAGGGPGQLGSSYSDLFPGITSWLHCDCRLHPLARRPTTVVGNQSWPFPGRGASLSLQPSWLGAPQIGFRSPRDLVSSSGSLLPLLAAV